MRSRPLPCIVLVALSTIYLVGCGTSSPNCGSFAAGITPITATLDHTNSANSQTYSTTVTAPSGCPLPPLPAPVWTLTLPPTNNLAASISQSGVATCKAAVSTPIIVSAGKSYDTATLVCE
jgi:hypothetical protein